MLVLLEFIGIGGYTNRGVLDAVTDVGNELDAVDEVVGDELDPETMGELVPRMFYQNKLVKKRFG